MEIPPLNLQYRYLALYWLLLQDYRALLLKPYYFVTWRRSWSIRCSLISSYQFYADRSIRCWGSRGPWGSVSSTWWFQRRPSVVDWRGYIHRVTAVNTIIYDNCKRSVQLWAIGDIGLIRKTFLVWIGRIQYEFLNGSIPSKIDVALECLSIGVVYFFIGGVWG